jgi:hypothetical protein
MARQVTQYPDDLDSPEKLAQAERDLYYCWLPGMPKAVLDLAGGLGRTTVSLHNWYCSPRIHYHLVDGDKVCENLVGGWEPEQQEWCNDFGLTWKFLRANGLKAGQVFTHDLTGPHDCFAEIPPVDLVISTLAVGFHWPIEPWLERLRPVCHENTRLIFGVRHGKYGPESRFDGFEFMGFAESGWKQDFLALKLRQ